MNGCTGAVVIGATGFLIGRIGLVGRLVGLCDGGGVARTVISGRCAWPSDRCAWPSDRCAWPSGRCPRPPDRCAWISGTIIAMAVKIARQDTVRVFMLPPGLFGV